GKTMTSGISLATSCPPFSLLNSPNVWPCVTLLLDDCKRRSVSSNMAVVLTATSNSLKTTSCALEVWSSSWTCLVPVVGR
ncbi:hypothetical protein RUM44_006075, partial [Polyplax serrata]